MPKTSSIYLFISLLFLSFFVASCGDELDLGPTTVSTGYLVSADDLTIEVGKSIAYRDRSVGSVTWAWDFEGGSPARAFEQSPRATYNEPGTFITTLITTFEDGSRRRFSLRPRVLPGILPDFTADSQINTTENPITFMNLTSGVGEIPATLGSTDTIASYEWTFEGGTPATSSASNPSVIYSETGAFDVTLKVIRSVTDSEEVIVKEGFIVIE